MDISNYTNIVNEVLPMLKTSLKYSDIIDLGSEVFKIGVKELGQGRFPRDEYCEGKMIEGIYYLTFDKEKTVKQLYEYIFEDIES